MRIELAHNVWMHMNLVLDMKLQEDLAEGVIRLNTAGQVTDFNRAAVPWIKYAVAARNQLRLLIGQIALGTRVAPVQVHWSDTGDGDLSGHTVHLLTADAHGHTLFIGNSYGGPSAGAPTAFDADFFRLIGEEARHELTRMKEDVMQVLGDRSMGADRVNAGFDRLSRVLVAFDQISRLHRSDVFKLEARFSLWQLVNRLLDEMPRDRCDFFITPAQEEKVERGSLINGDTVWIETTIGTLITAITESAPAHSKVEMRVRRNGAYVVLSSHFSHESGSETRSRRMPTVAVESALRLDTDIGKQICRRIIELHGGQLILVEQDPEGNGVAKIESFTVTLPVGTPSQAGREPACSTCPTSTQMQRYATDIAFLLERQPVVDGPTAQELEMLSRLMTSAGNTGERVGAKS